jgi:outer membrane protein assembly factor BamB
MSVRRLAVLLLMAVALSGCEAVTDFFESRSEKLLPGERISVLSLQRTVRPDPRIADLDVRLPRPYVNEDWPQAGGHPSHAMHHIAMAEAPERHWVVRAGEGAGDLAKLTATPVVSGGMVFVLDSESSVAAFRVDDGSRVWRYNLTPDGEERGAIGGGLGVDGDTLYVTTAYGDVVALETGTGAEIWRHPAGSPLRGAPTLLDGRLFAMTYDNQMVALDAATGSQSWTHAGITESASLIGGATPTAEGDVVIAAYSSGEIVAIRVENGRVLWSDQLVPVGRLTPLSDLSDISGSPVVDRGFVIAVSYTGRTVAIDLRSGSRIWEQELGGTQTPWVAGDFVFLVTGDAEVVCLSRNSGRIRWVTELTRWNDPEKKRDPFTWYGPVLASDRLIVLSSEGDAIALSPYNGEILGRIQLPDGVSLPPVVAGGTIFVLTDDGDLATYR